MASTLRQFRAKVSETERHDPCIQYCVADEIKSRRAGKRIEAMRKPPTKEFIGTKTSQVEGKSKKASSTSSRVTIPNARMEIQPMTVEQPSPAQLSFQTLSHTMEANSALEATHPDQSKFANRDRVVLEHLPLVRAIAVRVHDNLPVHVDLDDLIHAGIMGLFDAATKFDTDKNVAFSSYAKHRIKGAILDSLRQLDWASRDLRRRHKQVEAVTRDLASELQRNPTEQEIANKMGVEVERWRQMMIDLRNVGLVSASTRTHESEDMPAPDFPTSPDHHPDTICAREELRGLLKTALNTLPERYQRVVLLYYSNELTMKEIGGMLGINESRVSQIHKAALEKMANALGQAGISSAAAF
jgi:RNA polymerase sigma factor FliA